MCELSATTAVPLTGPRDDLRGRIRATSHWGQRLLALAITVIAAVVALPGLPASRIVGAQGAVAAAPGANAGQAARVEGRANAGRATSEAMATEMGSAATAPYHLHVLNLPPGALTKRIGISSDGYSHVPAEQEHQPRGRMAGGAGQGRAPPGTV